MEFFCGRFTVGVPWKVGLQVASSVALLWLWPGIAAAASGSGAAWGPSADPPTFYCVSSQKNASFPEGEFEVFRGTSSLVTLCSSSPCKSR